MSIWKQLAFCVVVLVIAAAAWVKFFPGAPEILASWGIDWAQAATDKAAKRPERPPRHGRPAQSQRPAGDRHHRHVTNATINDRLSAIGTGRANNSVVVTPLFRRPPDRDQGDVRAAVVEAGSVIARLDSDTEEIAVDRAKIALDDAQAKLDRVKSLQHSNTATAVAGEGRRARRSRMPSWSCATPSSRWSAASIVAPIDGMVGILRVEAGNQVTNATPIATLDDRSTILVDFWVPERFAGTVKVGAPLSADADRQARGGAIDGHGERRRQPGRRGQPHAPGPRQHRQCRRPAARRHVVLDRHEIPRRHLSGGQSAGDPVGRRRRLRLGDRGRQGQARAGPHHPAQHRHGAGRRPTSPAATWW